MHPGVTDSGCPWWLHSSGIYPPSVNTTEGEKMLCTDTRTLRMVLHREKTSPRHLSSHFEAVLWGTVMGAAHR